MIKHKDWDINGELKGFTPEGQAITGATLQNGLNDIEPDGSFVPCEMDIDAISLGVTTHKIRRGRYGQLRLGDTTTNKPLIKIKDKDSKGISLQYIDGKKGNVIVGDKKASFESVDGVGIEITPNYKGVKIEFVISDPQTAPLEYPCSLKDYGQKYDYEIVDGAIIGTGEDGKKITLHAPYAIDADGETGQVYYVMTGAVNNLQTFKKVVDETWLRQAAAPVKIDPNVTITDGVDGGVIEDTYLFSGFPNNNYGVSPQLRVGDTTGGLTKVDLSAFSSISSVITAHFGFNVILNSGSPSISWYEVLVSWVEGGANNTSEFGSPCWDYNTFASIAWGAAGCKGAGVDRNSVADGSKSITATGPDWLMPISSALAFKWATDTNNGLISESLTPSTLAILDSSEGTIKPYFYMEYTEGPTFNPAWARNSNQIIGMPQ